MGLKADIIIWDLTSMTLLHRMSLHKVSKSVQSAYAYDGVWVVLHSDASHLPSTEVTLANLGQGPSSGVFV